MKRTASIMLLAGSLAIAAMAQASSPPPRITGDAARGAQVYENNCTGCHSIDRNRVGPAHRGVFGRRAGRAAEYDYSEALRGARITWTAANLERWLTNPQAMVPGTRMGFRLTDAQRRADVIAYLRTQTTRR